MALNTSHFAKCIETLEVSLKHLGNETPGTTDYDVFRYAVVKGFELCLELAGKLLRKSLRKFGGSPREIDALLYKDVFRRAAKHGLLDSPEVERWFVYRENRNQTAHDYGAGFAEATLVLLPGFLTDARRLETRLRQEDGDA